VKFKILRDFSDEPSVEATYYEDELKPDPYGRVDHSDEDHTLGCTERCVPRTREDHTYRICATAFAQHGGVLFTMQHLKISDPPYTLATAPGRMVDTEFEEFSEFVDGLVAMRDKMRGER
jgi:hypothetical protein